MAKFIANSPCADLLPLTVGTVTLDEIIPPSIYSVSPANGQQKAVSQTFKSAIAVNLPAPNRTGEADDTRVMWLGIDQWLVFGAGLPDLGGKAAVTDQSDAWAIVRMSGDDVEAVLARLVPVDLRAKVFRKGHTARTLIGHMTGSVTRLSPKSFEIMVMRSMASTLVHELERAALGFQARST